MKIGDTHVHIWKRWQPDQTEARDSTPARRILSCSSRPGLNAPPRRLASRWLILPRSPSLILSVKGLVIGVYK